jgi:hypothetical protein
MWYNGRKFMTLLNINDCRSTSDLSVPADRQAALTAPLSYCGSISKHTSRTHAARSLFHVLV